MAQNFDEAAQRELAKFLEAEQAKARLQQSIHTFCDLAFDKCVTKIGTLIYSLCRPTLSVSVCLAA